jgi:hypothetical protein
MRVGIPVLLLTVAATAAVAAGTWATAAYLDAKYHLSKDITILRKLKQAERDYQKRVAEDRVNVWYILQDSCHKHWDDRAIWFQVRSNPPPSRTGLT